MPHNFKSPKYEKSTLLLSAFCFLQIIGFTQNQLSDLSANNDVISNFIKLSQQQLIDTANAYFNNNSTDTALICYSLIINSPARDNDIEQQKKMIEAYLKSGIIFFYSCDYRNAYNYYIKALLLCEKINEPSYISRIYNNLGNIYHRFKRCDLAKNYYTKALNLYQDSVILLHILNNIGTNENLAGNNDSAFFYLNKALYIGKKINYQILDYIYNNIAMTYVDEMQYDSAYHYYHLALEDARKNNKPATEALVWENIGEMFLKINKTDSALYFFNLSKNIAEENNALEILGINYLNLSKIAESKGNIKGAFENYKMYVNIKDSIFDIDIFGDINQLQRLYEAMKTNQQIEQLALEQQIKERTIHYQKIIQFIILSVLLLVSCGLVFIYLQKRNLSRAYKILVEKNIEIINIQANSHEYHHEKNKKNILSDDLQTAILDKILNQMKDTAVICDTEFSLDKLAELVGANHAYVSQTINTLLKVNFRSFLNGYRIREAQRLFTEPDATKYTIESIALQVGFKSRNAFREAFKEITGVTPNFYLQSMQEKK